MKRAALLILLPVLLWPRATHAQDVQDFVISSFQADYYLGRDQQGTSTLKTDETITAEFPTYDQNHGILRALPESYLGHTISLKVDGVTNGGGTPLHYTTSHDNGNLVLKIGDANKYVHGEQVYKINYESRNVIDLLNNSDEFDWDVNGDQWSQNFMGVIATLHISRDLQASLQQKRACYAGYQGSNAQGNCQITDGYDSDGSKVVLADAQNLSAGQTLTFVVGFNKGTFKLGPEIAQEHRRQNQALAAGAVLVALPPLAALAVMLGRWRKFGNDPKGRGVIIPQYEPPKAFSVLMSDYLLKERLRGKAISAMLIDLAVNGKLTIIELGKKDLLGHKDYELRLESDPQELDGEILRTIKLIFGDMIQPGSVVKLSQLQKRAKNDTSVYNEMKQIEKQLASKLTTLGYFIKDPIYVRRGYKLWSIVPIAAAFGVGYIVPKVFSGSDISVLLSVCFCLGMVLTAAVMFGFSYIMPARSLSGVEVRDELKGLQDYIKMAEADRLRYLQSPEGAEKIADKASFDPSDSAMKIKLFEKLLPYAIIFGLEKDWAKQFSSIYTQAPSWYQGNWPAFNTIYLGDSLSAFSAVPALSFSSPSSASGGGMAGGGGGGGGGGGW